MENIDIKLAAIDAWDRAQTLLTAGKYNFEKGVFVGLFAFLAILKWSQLGHGETWFEIIDEDIEGGKAQVISWRQKGRIFKFRTIAIYNDLSNHPKTKMLEIILPNSGKMP